MASVAAPDGGRPSPSARWRWRRAAARLVDSRWLRLAAALLAIGLAVLPLGVVALGAQRQAVAVETRATAEARLAADVAGVRLGIAQTGAALDEYLASADSASLDAAVAASRRTANGWTATASDAGDAGLTPRLGPAGAALAAWERWAETVERAPAADVPASADAEPQGRRLEAAADAALANLQAGAGAAAARDAAMAGMAVGRFVPSGQGLAALLGCGVIAALGALLAALALRPIAGLARAAAGLAGGEDVPLPDTDRLDEVGSLARGLARWRQSERSRRAIVELSPVALATLGPDLELTDTNPATRAMFGFADDDRASPSLAAVIHPDDLSASRAAYDQLATGERDHIRLEKRYVRRDGTTFWGSLTAAAVRGPDGSPASYVCMIEDISDRREKIERAAQVQRDLLPAAPPKLEGYELAGLCRPSEAMGGDFYDWRQEEPGTLTLTVGDVMGKGMPAALLMAVVRIALRAGATLPSLGDTMRGVVGSAGRDLERVGAFVTLFHGRLDLASGELRYVDAGHGLLVVAGRGDVRRLRGTALPLGVTEEERYEEARLVLRPGDALVVFSDGVLDVHPVLEHGLDAVEELLAGVETAQEMAERLASGPGSAGDDVTVVVLRRLPRAAHRR